MPAPLHSRWRRQFDKVFRTTGYSPAQYLHLKNKLQPYAVSDNAAIQLGHDSTKVGVEWFDIASTPMPHKQFMVEFNWEKYHEELMHAGKEIPNGKADGSDRPTRCGFIFMDDPDGWICFYLVLYPGGTFMLAPGLLTFSRREYDTPGDPLLMGIGYPYHKILNHINWQMDRKLESHAEAINLEFAGLARQCLSAYGAVVQARLPTFTPADPDAPFRERKTSGKVIELDETNMYLSNRTIRGEVHYEPSEEPQKRTRHEVRGHWCYRRGREDPFTCNIPSGRHDWEGDDARQTCIHCGQKRWFRPSHERGEGEISQKVRNIRV